MAWIAQNYKYVSFWFVFRRRCPHVAVRVKLEYFAVDLRAAAFRSRRSTPPDPAQKYGNNAQDNWSLRTSTSARSCPQGRRSACILSNQFQVRIRFFLRVRPTPRL